jgi:hypothetical protein
MRCFFVIALVGSLFAADYAVQAQSPTPNTRRALSQRGRRGVARREPTPAATPQPVTVVPAPARPEYLFGQAQVTVRGNEDPIIRLGLAQHGPIVVEFPASDNYAVR